MRHHRFWEELEGTAAERAAGGSMVVAIVGAEGRVHDVFRR